MSFVVEHIGSEEFGDSTYSVRARQTWLGLFGFRPTDYDITTIPALSRARFSFSWTTGVLRREPDGPDLVAVRASGGVLALGRRTYFVADARTGAPIGTLLPKSSFWEIQDPFGAHVAHVVTREEGAGRSRYVATADGRELCKFLWGFTGLTAASAELQVEFLPGAEGRLSRALVIGISPVLERQANRASQWSSS